MAPVEAAKSIVEEIGHFATKQPIPALHFLALYLMIGGQFWLLWEGARSDRARENMLVVQAKAGNEQIRSLLRNLIEQLQKESPTKIDERDRIRFGELIKENEQELKQIRDRQDDIMRHLETIRLSIDGKTGR